MSNSWIGKFTFIGDDPYRIDWLKDGYAGLSEMEEPSRVRTVRANEIHTVRDIRQMKRAIKEFRRTSRPRVMYVCPQDQIERMITDGVISEEDLSDCLGLHGYGGIYGDDERIPDDVWTRALGDLNALTKFRAHAAAEQKAIDQQAASKMH